MSRNICSIRRNRIRLALEEFHKRSVPSPRYFRPFAILYCNRPNRGWLLCEET